MICVSTQDWNDLWTRKQRFMKKFAQRGNRVLYIESQASLLSLSALKSDWRKIFRWLKGPRKTEKNLYIGTLPLLLPFFQMSLTINAVNNFFISCLLKRWTGRLGLRQPILFVYHPCNESLIGRLGEKVAVYECVDELSASKGLVRNETVIALEKRLLKKADIVVVTHRNLLKSKEHLAKKIRLIPNAADIEHFKKAALSSTSVAPEMRGIPRPVIGFIGSVQYWIDLDLIRELAGAHPDWSFVLIGPVGRLAKISKIKGLKNVHLLGRKDYNDLPTYLRAFDVCINPYIVDRTSDNCSPLKLYEYLAAGKPVVSADMPEAGKFSGVLETAHGAREFGEKIQRILDGLPEGPSVITTRMKAVEEDSWDRRFEELEKVLEACAGSI